jgi:hypothetical protein
MMPSLTITLSFKVELSTAEMNLILRALDVQNDVNDEASHELAKKLRQQRDAFVRSMQKQLKEGGEEDP